MSYCINCGVELDASAKKCALCGTKVINPNEGEVSQTAQTPFSQVAHIPKEVKTRFIASVVSLVMLIPNIVCFLANAVLFPGGFWSVYIMATSTLIWIVFVLPFFLKKHRAYLMWAFDTLAVCAHIYLFMAFGNSLHMYLGCAFPIILINSALILFYLIWVRRKKRNGILKALFICIDVALSFLICGILLSTAGAVKYAGEIGIIVFLCIAAVVAFLAYCYSSKSIRKWLSKRLFT